MRLRAPIWIFGSLLVIATVGAQQTAPSDAQVPVQGAIPNAVLQPQKIFVAVANWAWISMPITASQPSFIYKKRELSE